MKIKCIAFLTNIYINVLNYWFFNHIVSHIPIWSVRKLFYKCGGVKIGKNARILCNVTVDNPKGISIGENSYINEHVYLDGRGGIEIGSNVSISIYSKIITTGHDINGCDFAFYKKPVSVGDNAWLAANSMVLGGNQVPNGCVICAGAVVPEDSTVLQSEGVYAGVPVRIVAKRFSGTKRKQDTWKPYFR